ncbi:DUF7019 family protein [Streptomyces sp. KR55]|uniref:DUF7019 family protein n=1 Tax=Streptomyces sp. KR55 TaxID=3457425 RepID=UPI003FD58DCB
MSDSNWPKHFLYFSSDKVDALYEQITMRKRRRLAGELEVDLKLLKGRMSFDTAPENFYLKLRMVVDHLKGENAVGSLREPAPYFAGRLPMTWGPLGTVDGDLASGVVFFGGRQEGRSVGLGGSSWNVVGQQEDCEVARPSGSHAPAMLEALRQADPASPGDALAVRLLRGREGGDGRELNAVERAIGALPGITQDVEFVARRLIEGVSADGARTILLGTPLYVALAD